MLRAGVEGLWEQVDPTLRPSPRGLLDTFDSGYEASRACWLLLPRPVHTDLLPPDPDRLISDT